MDDWQTECLRRLDRRDDVLEQQATVHGLDTSELRGLVVDQEQGRILRGQQVVTDRVAYRQAGHQGCTCEPYPRSSRIDCMTWKVVLAVKTSAAASTPVYFLITGSAAAAV